MIVKLKLIITHNSIDMYSYAYILLCIVAITCLDYRWPKLVNSVLFCILVCMGIICSWILYVDASTQEVVNKFLRGDFDNDNIWQVMVAEKALGSFPCIVAFLCIRCIMWVAEQYPRLTSNVFIVLLAIAYNNL